MKEEDKGDLENIIRDQLSTQIDGVPQYLAGHPGFRRVFARDSILSCLLMKDYAGLRHILQHCISTQGSKQDHLTGEEEGKIFHEFPGVEIRGRYTDFNASDTAALFLIGMENYQRNVNDDFADKNLESVKKAVDYIKKHIKNDLFVEDPSFCNSDKFALKVTYWKDSSVAGRNKGEPSYPVAYSLLQAQVISALRSASRLLEDDELGELSGRLNEALWTRLYDDNLKTLAVGRDEQGIFSAVTSDALHSLYYLEKADVPSDKLEEIVQTSKKLESPAGYRTAYTSDRKYHSGSIWPFEQAFIHEGAKKFGLKRVQDVASRIVKSLGQDNSEYIFYNDSKKNVQKKGCNPQLWTIASKIYFMET